MIEINEMWMLKSMMDWAMPQEDIWFVVQQLYAQMMGWV